MKNSALLAGLVASVSLLALAGSAAAASPATDAFVANVRPNVDYLDDSSRLALDKSKSPAVRAFAHREAMEQTVAGNSLVAWTQTNTVRGEDVALGHPLPGTGAVPLAGLAAVPLGVVGDVTSGVGDLATGRSVAIDRPLTVTPNVNRDAPTLGGALLPSDAKDLDRLRNVSGREFDALYRSTQLDALRQLSVLYRDYAASGDDPALQALARRELPRVNARIVELRKL